MHRSKSSHNSNRGIFPPSIFWGSHGPHRFALAPSGLPVAGSFYTNLGFDPFPPNAPFPRPYHGEIRTCPNLDLLLGGFLGVVARCIYREPPGISKLPARGLFELLIPRRAFNSRVQRRRPQSSESFQRNPGEAPKAAILTPFNSPVNLKGFAGDVKPV
jgi:hypothetical protein